MNQNKTIPFPDPATYPVNVGYAFALMELLAARRDRSPKRRAA